MKLGQAKCPYCKMPLSTSIKIYESHLKNCDKNPDNWNDVDNQAKQWIKEINVDDFDR